MNEDHILNTIDKAQTDWLRRMKEQWDAGLVPPSWSDRDRDQFSEREKVREVLERRTKYEPTDGSYPPDCEEYDHGVEVDTAVDIPMLGSQATIRVATQISDEMLVVGERDLQRRVMDALGKEADRIARAKGMVINSGPRVTATWDAERIVKTIAATYDAAMTRQPVMSSQAHRQSVVYSPNPPTDPRPGQLWVRSD
jgi:hypothetical protein